MRERRLRNAVLGVCLSAVLLAGQTPPREPETGKSLYGSACLACHGPDGRGATRAAVGFELPLPDLTDCNFATREPDGDWSAIIHKGGPARGFSTLMPAFGEALTPGQIDKVVAYVRTFCPDSAWPRGDLNFPRALFTEKAFPEDEAVVTTSVNLREGTAASQKYVYERRFGARNQVEFTVPLSLEKPGGWAGGLGDVAAGFKRMLFSSMRTGSIFSLTGEAVLPTGDARRGFGKGVTVFESFATYGQMLPKNGFVQFQGGVELPTHTEDAARAVFWRSALGATFSQDHGFGRSWSPMMELLADREFETGARVNWDVVPQFQVTLSKRQHIMANFGVRVPANNTAGRPVQLVFYLLWDWFDGGLRQGW